MNKECEACGARKTCLSIVKFGSIVCMTNRLSIKETKEDVAKGWPISAVIHSVRIAARSWIRRTNMKMTLAKIEIEIDTGTGEFWIKTEALRCLPDKLANAIRAKSKEISNLVKDELMEPEHEESGSAAQEENNETT